MLLATGGSAFTPLCAGRPPSRIPGRPLVPLAAPTVPLPGRVAGGLAGHGDLALWGFSGISTGTAWPPSPHNLNPEEPDAPWEPILMVRSFLRGSSGPLCPLVL